MLLICYLYFWNTDFFIAACLKTFIWVRVFRHAALKKSEFQKYRYPLDRNKIDRNKVDCSKVDRNKVDRNKVDCNKVEVDRNVDRKVRP